MTTNAFAAAAQAASPAQPAQQSQALPDTSGESQLFSGQGGASFPSLFNKIHFLGTERTGVITGIKDVQSRFYSTEGPGKLKYWENTTSGQKGSKPVENPIGLDGQPNRKVMDTLLTVTTDYRMTVQEAAAVGRKPEFVSEDDGTRVFAAGGFDLKTLREALIAYNDAHPQTPIRGNADLIGKRLTVKRAGQKPNPGGNPSWELTIAIGNA